MPLRALNDYVTIQTTDAVTVNLPVENGLITDGNGNQVVIGELQSGAVSWGHRDEGVDRVKNASPTGNLEVRNQAPYVDGYGEVELTNSAHRRTITQVGNTDGNDGDLLTDGSGVLTLEYEETEETVSSTTTSDSTTITAVGAVATPSVTVPSVSGDVDTTETVTVVSQVGSGDVSGTSVNDPAWASQQTQSYTVSDAAPDDFNSRTFAGGDYAGETYEGRADIDSKTGGASNGVEATAQVTVTYTTTTTTTKTRSVTLF